MLLRPYTEVHVTHVGKKAFDTPNEKEICQGLCKYCVLHSKYKRTRNKLYRIYSKMFCWETYECLYYTLKNSSIQNSPGVLWFVPLGHRKKVLCTIIHPCVSLPKGVESRTLQETLNMYLSKESLENEQKKKNSAMWDETISVKCRRRSCLSTFWVIFTRIQAFQLHETCDG